MGDWVIGIAPEELDSKLCYVAHITNRLCGCQYYGSKEFRHRSDVIYRIDKHGKYALFDETVHQQKDMPRDIGEAPEYGNAWILVSDRGHFWYFGKSMKSLTRSKYPRLMKKIDHLTQGHRVHHSAAVRRELESPIQSIQREYTTRKYGIPRNGHAIRKCYPD